MMPAERGAVSLDRDALITAHVGLVKAMAQRLARRLPANVEVADLVSIGTLGLVEAAGRYRLSMGVPFEAFARRRVQGAMLDELRDLDWAPRSLRRRRREVDGAISALRSKLGREPSEAETAGLLGLTEAEYGSVLEELRSLELASIRSLDDAGSDHQPMLDVCIDPGEGPHARLERHELRQLLAAAIGRLPERERLVLAMYYDEEMTLAEIGVVLGVGESRVSQVRSMAVARLRTMLNEALRVRTDS